MAKQIRQKSSWLLILALVLMAVGAGVLLYPRWTAWQYRGEVDRIYNSFEETVTEPQEEDLLDSLYSELQRRNRELFETRQADLTDPFAYEQTAVSLEEYGLEDNIIGFLRIPAIDLELPILLGASKENLELGAAHLTQTSYPIGGDNTNCVLAAHRGYYKAPMLREVEQLEIGDRVEVENFRETLTYTVCETRIIDPTDIDQLLIQPGRDLLTLVTCHPLGSNAQRYVVFCERTE